MTGESRFFGGGFTRNKNCREEEVDGGFQLWNSLCCKGNNVRKMDL